MKEIIPVTLVATLVLVGLMFTDNVEVIHPVLVLVIAALAYVMGTAATACKRNLSK